MITPQVVVFDLGKVLLDFDYSIAARKLALRCKIDAEAITKLINQSPLLMRYERSELSTPEFFAEFRSASGFNGTFEEFAPLFGDIFAPIPPMISLQATLKKNGVPTYIFSNTNELAITHIRRTFPFFNNFDGYIFSYEHAVMKPDQKIYEVVEQMTNRRSEQILYLDDRAENVEGGATRNWQVILHEAPEKTIATFKKLGLPT